VRRKLFKFGALIHILYNHKIIGCGKISIIYRLKLNILNAEKTCNKSDDVTEVTVQNDSHIIKHCEYARDLLRSL
jgi:hypothetical protein